ncbi:hypothetical protein Tsubulata_043800 [Turnera subulata]|uniref:Transcriptional adapter n=1 Tax=Turnera subulata TaxID=218843 RepID=A0A9Q0JMH4_9ROSI|nr:hypothetical protein Tsubulata_043800 [Turnera subulata]
MGRSRARTHPADEDPSRSGRAKRKKLASSNVETVETGTTASQETAPGKAALYHCNYCNKDISGMIRIKCAVCPDFDLCIECFSVGAEVTPHKCNHPYRVMDNLSFPLICPDWNADEEMLLLEGIEMYGFGNWTEVAEHVGTKSKSQCIDHYRSLYLNSPCFPLPDLSHVMGKSREELLAMAKGHGESKKDFPTVTELLLKDESSLSERIKTEAPGNEDVAGQSSSILTSVGSHMDSSSGNSFTVVAEKASNLGQIKDSVKLEDNQSDRRIGEKKPRLSGDEGPSLTELSGYNVKRQEFEIEYDNDAEQLLADMDFKDTDTDAERELKLRVLRIYSKRLDERKRRKDFILERGLLYPDLFEKRLSPEEKEIYQRYKVFMRFHKKEEHEELMKNVIDDYRLAKKINDLQEARAAGCRTTAEAYEFIEQKRKKEAEESAQRLKESANAGSSGKTLPSPRGVIKGPTTFLPGGQDLASTSAHEAISSSLDDWDIAGLPGADLLSESEQRLCCEMRILPAHYLSMLQDLSVAIMKGTVNDKSDAHDLFKVEPSKVDRVYDMLVKKGITQA